MTRDEFENIIRQFYPVIYKVALDFFGSKHDAADVAQEASLHLWQWCERIDADRDIKALAIRVTKCRCIDLYRKRQKRGPQVEIDNAKDWESNSVSTPLEHVVESEIEEAYRLAIESLPTAERQIFEMRQVEGLDNEDIANITGIKRTSIKVMLSNARKKVYDRIKKSLES